ncbi:MAG: hypothetical protein J6R80_01615, partial [Kiritimatiellae bacterium]|nr:hypothetical protein [Kiritimatiellia bacterium]
WDFQYPMPELIQQDFTVRNVVKYLRSWLVDEEANAAARASLAKASQLLMTSDKPIDEIVRVITAK